MEGAVQLHVVENAERRVKASENAALVIEAYAAQGHGASSTSQSHSCRTAVGCALWTLCQLYCVACTRDLRVH
jgi:hypothetical protein